MTSIDTHHDQHDADSVSLLRLSASAFGCGLLTGAALGILFAPARGRDVRRQIVWRARTGRARATRLVARARGAVERQKARVDDFKRAVGRQAEEIQAGVAGAVHDVQAAFDRGRREALRR